jgi:tRNA uridine 5-carboxymethylaminomethyl modification enzyme
MTREIPALELLRRPEVRYQHLMDLRDHEGGQPLRLDPEPSAAVQEQVEIQVKYAGYIARQQDEVQRHSSQEEARIPEDIDYVQVRGLSTEVRQKLQKIRPQTLGQASRISGLTPAAISLLWVHLKRMRAGKGIGSSAEAA